MKTDYLRVSVTDRCNLRCVYCHPLCGCDFFIERKEILRLEEIYRIVRFFVECGIRKVRLTGGEPLVRKNIVYLVKKLAGIEEIEELTLTTNGILLESLAAELKNAGLQRVNISVDSAENQSYKEITGFDLLPRVTKGIYKALEVGLSPVKINSVIIKGINVSQILPLAQMSVYLPVVVRFIEYCPTSKYTKPASDYVPTSEVREIIENKFGPLSTMLTGATNGPALYFRIKNSAGTIGFISGRSSIFCHSCNRLRLTSDGTIKPCLYSGHSYDLKKLMRNGASDQKVLNLLKRIISEKSSYTKLNSFTDEFSMRKVGG
jgi:cyclic pyranopterin phosphate synthase